jgi:FMN phosphatase YigB (HAD superfamily)
MGEEVFEKFLKWAVTTGKTGVLIVHGRGLSSPSEPVLKKKVVDDLKAALQAGTLADLMPFDLFQKKLLLATQALMDNHGKMSNAEYFMSIFCKGFEAQRDEIWERFIRFYERGYDQFRTLVSVPEGVSEVFLQLQKENLKIVIASNPMWPLDVQKKRLSWAGLGDFHFDLVTHIEICPIANLA